MAEMILRFEGGVSPPVMTLPGYEFAQRLANELGLKALARFFDELVIADQEHLDAVRRELSATLPDDVPKQPWGDLPEALAPAYVEPPIELFLDDPEDKNYVPPYPTTYQFEPPDDPQEAEEWEKERERLEADPPDDWPYLTPLENEFFIYHNILPERLRKYYGDRYPRFFSEKGGEDDEDNRT